MHISAPLSKGLLSRIIIMTPLRYTLVNGAPLPSILQPTNDPSALMMMPYLFLKIPIESKFKAMLVDNLNAGV